MFSVQVGTASVLPRPPPLAALTQQIDHHRWTQQALDAFETHSFTGRVGEMRWCSRCTLALPSNWKDARRPVPPKCDDPSIRFKAEMYLNGVSCTTEDEWASRLAECAGYGKKLV